MRERLQRSYKETHSVRFRVYLCLLFTMKEPHSRLYYAVRESLDQIRNQKFSIPKDETLDEIANIEAEPQSASGYPPGQLRLYHVKYEPSYSESPLFARLQKQDETIARLNRQVRQLQTENRVLIDRNEEYIAEMHKKHALNDQKVEEIEQVYSKRLEIVQNNYEEECQQTEKYRRTTEQQERQLRELQFHVNDLQRELAQAKAVVATLQSVAGPAWKPAQELAPMREHARRPHGDTLVAYARRDESGHKVVDAELGSESDLELDAKIGPEEDTMDLIRGIEPQANKEDEVSSTTELLLRGHCQ